jgi:hypothetical protein
MPLSRIGITTVTPYLVHASGIQPHDGSMCQSIEHGSKDLLAVEWRVLQEYFVDELLVEHCACNIVENLKMKDKID